MPTLAKKITFDEVWARLENSGIFSSSSQTVAKEAAFRDVSKLCKMGKASLLSEKVEEKIKAIVQASLVEMRTNAETIDDAVSFLNFFRDFWISFCIRMQTFRDVFLVLERTYLLATKGTTFWQIGLSAVKSKMNEIMRKRLMDGVIQLIQLDRNEEKMEHRDLIAKSIHVMLALDFYRDLFEPKFLHVTKIFFREYSATHFAQLNVSVLFNF